MIEITKKQEIINDVPQEIEYTLLKRRDYIKSCISMITEEEINDLYEKLKVILKK